MELSKRLQAIASMIVEGTRLADIGTDHGYLPIALIQQGKLTHAVAMDINQGPLLRAEEHIAAFGLQQYIETRLSDGLHALIEGEADCIVIAGMGGALTLRILSDKKERLSGIKELVLQPQSEIPLVRRALYGLGFRIQNEEMVMEDGKFYTVIRAVPCVGTEVSAQDGREIFERFGEQLLCRRHPILLAYLKSEEKKYETIRIHLNQREEERARLRIQEIDRELKMIREAKRYYDDSEEIAGCDDAGLPETMCL